jgi:hypothetical protein
LIAVAISVSLVVGCTGEPGSSTSVGQLSGGGSDSKADDPIATSTAGEDTGAVTSPDSGDATQTTSGNSTASSMTSDATAGSGSSDSTGAASTGENPPATIPPENLKVAFFGDNDNTSAAADVLQLVVEEGAEFVVVLGDFDYGDDPSGWHEQIDDNLGADFPLFAVPGNHDEDEWDGYREVLMDRRSAIADADCNGPFSEQEGCLYKGVFLALSSVGTLSEPSGAPDHEEFLAGTLAQTDAIWKICAWHKNQHDMQVGDKSNEVGWGAYEACQDGGAIIATGHEHSYARTMTLTDLGNAGNGHGAATASDPAVVEVGPGKNFVFVSGLGGRGVRDYASDHDDDTWWASMYASDRYVLNGQEIDSFDDEWYGVLFIDFHVDGDPYKARGYFKTTTGEVLDEFVIFADHP